MAVGPPPFLLLPSSSSPCVSARGTPAVPVGSAEVPTPVRSSSATPPEASSPDCPTLGSSIQTRPNQTVSASTPTSPSWSPSAGGSVGLCPRREPSSSLDACQSCQPGFRRGPACPVRCSRPSVVCCVAPAGRFAGAELRSRTAAASLGPWACCLPSWLRRRGRSGGGSCSASGWTGGSPGCLALRPSTAREPKGGCFRTGRLPACWPPCSPGTLG
uniref:Putative secreted protein n=1 Tax=Ixodes ricinus TaxID=34613 RepID=A0A6B0V536_IXORI